MIQKFKRMFGSLFWHQYMLTAGMVLLTIFMLGVSFLGLSYTRSISAEREEMLSKAQRVAQMCSYFLSGEDMDEKTRRETFENLTDIASRVADLDFLICDAQGNVLISTDRKMAGKSAVLPDAIMDSVRHQEIYEGISFVGGLYTSKMYIVGVPVYHTSNGELVGVVLSVMERGKATTMWHTLIGVFIMAAAIILLISFVVSSLMAMRQAQPIQEMVQATRAYANGNFDVRIIPDSECGYEIEELARSFNAMADSLQETERQRRDFIANVSHELKTPMTTIAGYTDGILDGTIPPEKERHYLQIISDESRRLSRLVRRMLDISQLQSQEMHKTSFDICESMRIALLSMERKITDRNLDVEAEIPDDSVMVDGDNDLITQVIYNLLENAVKYADADSTIYIGMEVKDDKALVSIRNHGNAIPPDEVPLLFERFHKSDKSRSVDKDGYGLGLYVVKTIIDQHGEKIMASSENGITTFSFTMQKTYKGSHIN